MNLFLERQDVRPTIGASLINTAVLIVSTFCHETGNVNIYGRAWWA